MSQQPLWAAGPELVGQGLMPDLPGMVPVFWEDGENVIFDDGAVQPTAGQLLLSTGATNEPIVGLRATVLPNGERAVYYGTQSGLFRWTEAGGDVSLGNFTFGAEHWSFARWGNWMIVSNGIDKVHVDKNPGFGELAGTTFLKARHLLVSQDEAYVFAVDTEGGAEGYPGRFHFCDRDNPEQWLGNLTNMAGFVQIRNLDTAVQAVLMLRDTPTFYTRGQMHIAEPAGEFVWGIRQTLSGFGAFGPRAVVEVQGRHFGFGPRGIWSTDGLSFQYVDVPLVREKVYNNLDLKYATRVVAWHNKKENMIVFFYPSKSGGGRVDKGVGFGLNGSRTLFGFGRTAVEDADVFEYAIGGDSDGNLWMLSAPGQQGSGISQKDLRLTEESPVLRFGWGRGPYGRYGYGGNLKL